MEDTNNKPILFGPISGKSLKREYPELAANKMFDSLSADELLFAWYMGNKSSPIDVAWPDSMRAKQAAWQCFPKGNTKRNQYASMDIPVSVKEAIEEMRKYSPEARLMALKMYQEMFHKLQTTIKTDVTELDLTEKRQYVEMCAKASDTIPIILKYIEDGFGVKETKKKSEESGSKPIDEFHQQKKEKK